MKTMSKKIATAAGVAMFATLLIPTASAGCGDPSTFLGPYEFQQPQFQAQYTPQAALSRTESARSSTGSASIVGMWNVQFVSKGNSTHNPPIPDGAIVDSGYSQWHSDGTEIMNSAGHAPATQNFCLGVWQKTGYSSYQLSHFALSYDATTGVLNGKVNIQETVVLSAGGTKYNGTFTIDVYDPTGKHVDHVAGDVGADRITVDTTTP
jgi:hypothetical protein